MRLTYPRLVGGIGLLFAAIWRKGLLDWPNDAVWMSCTLTWIAACLLLVAGRQVRAASAAVCLIALYVIAGPGPQLSSVLALFAWLGLILFVSEGRPLERALLVRVLIAVVYTFAALSKLNPTFLNGDQLVGILLSRDRFVGLVPTLQAGLGTALAVGALLAEAAIATGLWFERTRRYVIALGVAMHVTFVVVANYGTVEDVVYLTVLNGLLIASYLAFFEPISDTAGAAEAARVAHETGAETTTAS